MYINRTVLQNIKRKHFFVLYCIYMYIDTMYVARAAQLPWSTIGRALAQKPGGHGVQVMSKAAPVVFNFVMYMYMDTCIQPRFQVSRTIQRGKFKSFPWNEATFICTCTCMYSYA